MTDEEKKLEEIQAHLRRRFGQYAYQLLRAALNDDWGTMQRCQKSMQGMQHLDGNVYTSLRILMEPYVTPDLNAHCIHCGESGAQHDLDGKCLFDSSHFATCRYELNDSIRADMKAGRKIDAIKAIREATSLGLKEALDVYNYEARVHGWGIKK